MSSFCSYKSNSLIKQEMEAWWDMLNCIFNFLAASTNYTVQASLTDAKPALEFKETISEVSLDKFPFLLDMFEDTKSDQSMISVTTQTTPVELIKSVVSNRILNIQYSEAFKKCCQSMHRLEDSYIEDYESRQEEIFNILSQQRKILAANDKSDSFFELEQMAYSVSYNTNEELSEISNSSLQQRHTRCLLTPQCSKDSCEVSTFFDSEDTIGPVTVQVLEIPFCDVLPAKNSFNSSSNTCENYVDLSVRKSNSSNLSHQFQANQLVAQTSRPRTMSSKIPQRLKTSEKNKKTSKQHIEQVPPNKKFQISGVSSLGAYPKTGKVDQNLEQELLINNKLIEKTSSICKRKKVNLSTESPKVTIEQDSQTNDKSLDRKSLGSKRPNLTTKNYTSVESVVKKMSMPGRNTPKNVEGPEHISRIDKANNNRISKRPPAVFDKSENEDIRSSTKSKKCNNAEVPQRYLRTL